MVFAFASLVMVLLGGTIATDGMRHEAIVAPRAEFVGGSLLATGLLLIGVGIQSTF